MSDFTEGYHCMYNPVSVATQCAYTDGFDNAIDNLIAKGWIYTGYAFDNADDCNALCYNYYAPPPPVPIPVPPPPLPPIPIPIPIPVPTPIPVPPPVPVPLPRPTSPPIPLPPPVSWYCIKDKAGTGHGVVILDAT